MHRWIQILAMILVSPALAQPPEDDARIGQRLRVFVITMERGDAVWERWGHNTLCVQIDDEAGRRFVTWGLNDRFAAFRRQSRLEGLTGDENVYNWGIFDFKQERFFLNFLQGRMWYSMEADPLWMTVVQYQMANRSIWVQELELTAAQRGALARFLDWNALPENKDYFYDYFLDNCSTRVRDAVDLALGGQLEAATRGQMTGRSFRWHTRRLTADAFGWNATLNALAGQLVDREIDVWEEMFLPVRMMEHLREVRVANEAGEMVPLVKREWTLFAGTRPPEPAAAANRAGWYLLLGLAAGGLLAGLGYLSARSRVARWGWSVLAAPWALYTGGLGLVLVYGWLFTYHWAGYWNENLMQLNPLAAGLVVLGPLAVFGHERWMRWGCVLGLAVAGVAVAGVLLKALPWFVQGNGEVLALFVPVHLGVAAGLWLAVRGHAQRPAPMRQTGKPQKRAGRVKASKQ